MTSWTVGPADRVCNCRFDRPGLDPKPLDDGDRVLLGDVEQYGWHILQVTEHGPSPGWVFSVGMWHTLGSPEIGIFGLAASDGAHAINRIGEAIQSGLELGPDVVFRDGLEEGWPIAFRPVHES